MKNRAKCKLCNDIIESFHSTDYVVCKCGEISLDGGDALRCFATNWDNFLRVDDEGNEIIVTVKQTPDEETSLDKLEEFESKSKPSKKDLLLILDEMIKAIQILPPNAMAMPITHYDYASLLMFLASFLRAD